MRERDEFTEREKQRQALQAEEREREQISVQDKQQINEQFADEGAALKSMSTLIEGLYDTLRDVTGDNAALKKRVAELEKKQDIPEERVATLHATNISDLSVTVPRAGTMPIASMAPCGWRVQFKLGKALLDC
jgi:predicted transcriptional regulator